MIGVNHGLNLDLQQALTVRMVLMVKTALTEKMEKTVRTAILCSSLWNGMKMRPASLLLTEQFLLSRCLQEK